MERVSQPRSDEKVTAGADLSRSTSKIERADLFALAPLALQNNRTHRYHGDEMSVPLETFAATDQDRIRRVYDFVLRLHAIIGAQDNTAPETLNSLAEFNTSEAIHALLHDARALGRENADANPDEPQAKTIHDIRSGGLTFLIARLQLAEARGWDADDTRVVFFLSRDHLKIMRSALLGLDDARRAVDQQPRLHGTALLLEKWQRAVLQQGDRAVQLEVDAHFQGYVSESCIEFGALDRILYNLINNACRHTADETIRLTMLDLRRPELDSQGDNVRFVLSNRVSEADRERLAELDLGELFRPGISTTHSGLGLTVVADFVASAYGVMTREKALEGGYVGASLHDDHFIVWFHWPIAYASKSIDGC